MEVQTWLDRSFSLAPVLLSASFLAHSPDSKPPTSAQLLFALRFSAPSVRSLAGRRPSDVRSNSKSIAPSAGTADEASVPKPAARSRHLYRTRRTRKRPALPPPHAAAGDDARGSAAVGCKCPTALAPRHGIPLGSQPRSEGFDRVGRIRSELGLNTAEYGRTRNWNCPRRAPPNAPLPRGFLRARPETLLHARARSFAVCGGSAARRGGVVGCADRGIGRDT